MSQRYVQKGRINAPGLWFILSHYCARNLRFSMECRIKHVLTVDMSTPWLCTGRLVQKMNDSPYMRLQLMLILGAYPFHLIHIVWIIPLTASPAEIFSWSFNWFSRWFICSQGCSSKGHRACPSPSPLLNDEEEKKRKRIRENKKGGEKGNERRWTLPASSPISGFVTFIFHDVCVSSAWLGLLLPLCTIHAFKKPTEIQRDS